MPDNNFHHTINFWIKELDQYSFPQLLLQPTPSSWSMGQLYMHLIENTDWFFEQVRICASCNDNQNEEASPGGRFMLSKNEFPDAQLQGPPDNDHTPQPASKEKIIVELNRQKNDIVTLGELIRTSIFNGKTKHPGLLYFNAAEWFQFAEMHLRHHLRQKRRIDDFLKNIS